MEKNSGAANLGSAPISSKKAKISREKVSAKSNNEPDVEVDVIWNHMKRIENEDGSPTDEVACNYCKKRYKYISRNGTSTLWKHARKCLKNPVNLAAKKQKTLTIGDVQGGNKIGLWQFDQDLVRKALVKMIIVDELPFRFVEHEGFKEFVRVAMPMFKMISRVTVARDCLNLFASEKLKLKEVFANSQRVALTTDIWTSVQNMSYLCLTAHFIDSHWKLHKRVINFCVIDSHKGIVIGQTIESCLFEWGINKLSTITVDNASSNDTAVAYLKKKFGRNKSFLLNGDFFQVRCCAHIINLIVRDGVEEVKDSIARIRAVVRYVRSSPQRKLQFKSYCQRQGITSKSSLCLDVITRWNSTFLMLECALKFQKAFESLVDDPQLSDELKKEFPKDDDWETARVLVFFLGAFFEVTKKLSGSKYSTSNLYFHEISTIEETLNSWCNNASDCFLSRMAKKMKEKFDKYWGNVEKTNMMLLIGLVLDPRYKLKYVRFTYEDIYPAEKLNLLIKRITEVMKNMFNEYKTSSMSSSFHSSASTGNQSMDIDQEDLISSHESRVKDRKARYLQTLENEKNTASEPELDEYFAEKADLQLGDTGVLGWWQQNSFRFPILSQMARDVLAIPVSTVSSESAFSTGGRVLDRFRSSLTPKVVESLICTQDWLRSSDISVDVEEKLEELEELESDEMDEVLCNRDKLA